MTASERPLGSRYRLLERIGRGGMGEVWRGEDHEAHPLAFKLLREELATDPDVVRRFIGERSLLTSVDHPHVVKVHDLVMEGQTLAIVMELVPGGDLRQLLREHGPLAPSDVAALGTQIAAGLSAIHAQHIVHRDIKPENLLVDLTGPEPSVKISDFGVARLAIDPASANLPTMVAGTPQFMAPELFRSQTPTAGTDLYSLGMVLYELLCGITPFAGRDHMAVMYAHAELMPGRPDGVPDQLWDVIDRLVRKNPAERPFSAHQVAERLQQVRPQIEGLAPLSRLTTPPAPVPSAGQAAGGLTATQELPAVAPSQGETQLSPVRRRASSSQPPDHLYRGPAPAPIPTAPASYGPQPGHAPPPAPHAGQGHHVVATPAPITPRRRGGPSWWIAAVVALVVLALGAGFIFFDRRGTTANPPSSTTATNPVESSPAESSQAPSQASSTQEPSSEDPSPSEPSTPETTSSAPSSPSSSAPSSPPPFPSGVKKCSEQIGVNSVTSCAFAANVAAAYNQSSKSGVVEIIATSPVTKQSYSMTCTTAPITICRGGNDAAVYLRQA